VLHLVKSTVKKVHASGVSVISNQPDIANARIEFDNGCVANLTASRISMKVMRKMRLFQKDAYISIDFAEKEAEVFSLSDTIDGDDALTIEVNTGGIYGRKAIRLEKPETQAINSIKMELSLFAKAILNDTETAVPVADGFHAMEVAHQVLEKIRKNKVM
jgi:hypothetical protein